MLMSAVNASFEKLLDYEQRSLAFEPGQADGGDSGGDWAGVVEQIRVVLEKHVVQIRDDRAAGKSP